MPNKYVLMCHYRLAFSSHFTESPLGIFDSIDLADRFVRDRADQQRLVVYSQGINEIYAQYWYTKKDGRLDTPSYYLYEIPLNPATSLEIEESE